MNCRHKNHRATAAIRKYISTHNGPCNYQQTPHTNHPPPPEHDRCGSAVVELKLLHVTVGLWRNWWQPLMTQPLITHQRPGTQRQQCFRMGSAAWCHRPHREVGIDPSRLMHSFIHSLPSQREPFTGHPLSSYLGLDSNECADPHGKEN